MRGATLEQSSRPRRGAAPPAPPTVPAALRAALLALLETARLLATLPACRRALRAAWVALGAAIAVSVADRPAPPAAARTFLRRRAAATRLAELTGCPPPTAGGVALLVERARRAGQVALARLRLRAADRELGARMCGRVDAADPLLAPAVAVRLAAAQTVAIGAEATLAHTRAELVVQRSAAAAGARTALALAAAASAVAARRGARAGAVRAGRVAAVASVRAGRVAALASARAGRVAAVRSARGAVTAARWSASSAAALVLGLLAGLRTTGRGIRRGGAALGGVLGPAVELLAAPPARERHGRLALVRPIASGVVLSMLLASLVTLSAAPILARSVRLASVRLPDLDHLRPLAQPERTEIYDRDGGAIRVLYDEQDRVVVPLSRVPEVLQQAVIAAEDARFYEHHGVDARGILRAAVANLLNGETTQGGSTITQQLVRNAYPDLKDRSLLRKVKEASLAAQLERRVSKQQILAEYLNRVYFGSSYYGVQAASLGYFGKDVSRLTLPEAATLAGIIREPENANPRSDPAQAAMLRDSVLDRMVEQNMITPAQARAAKATRLRVRPRNQVPDRYPWFTDGLLRQLVDDPKIGPLLGPTPAARSRRLFQGGLRIWTTLDPRLQQAAEAAVRTWRPATGPDAALVAIDPRDGAVRAVVGGRSGKYNIALQARRQAGSAFKPFVLATALDAGISPDSVWDSTPWSDKRDICGIKWSVANYEGHGNGPMSLREATWHSVNAVYGRVMAKLCPARVVAMARRLGDMRIDRRDAGAPSIALGAASVYPIDMASAYATLAAMGTYHRPTFVSRIVDHGRVLYQADGHGEQRIPPALAYAETDVLKGVIKAGTGRAADIGRPAAGKTGTTSDFHDAWFVGYTPQLTAAVWMGYRQGEVEMRDVTAGGMTAAHVAGGTFPARIWHDFMQAALADQPPLDWPQPSDHLTYTLLPPPPTTVPPPGGQPAAQPGPPPGKPHGHGHGH